MEKHNLNSEEELLEIKKQKEEADRRMLQLEWVIASVSIISFLIMIFIASTIEMKEINRIILITVGSIILVIGIHNALKIEQVAGYYECGNCHYKYVPTYYSVLFAMHFGRTRYMKCPKCNKRSWNKKRLTK